MSQDSMRTARRANPLVGVGSGEPLAAVDAVSIITDLAEQIAELHAEGRLHLQIDVESLTWDEASSRCRLRPPAAQAVLANGSEHDDLRPPELQSVPELELPCDLAAARNRLRESSLDVDPRRIDVFQLGALLNRLVTGRPLPEFLQSPRVRGLMPVPLRGVVDAALGYDPQHRFGTPSEMLAALEHLDDESPREQTNADSSGEGPESAAASDPATRDTDLSGAAIPTGDTDVHGIPGDRAEQPSSLPFNHLGHFDITERIGHGGMGDVYRGYDASLDREVAIKVLPPEFCRSPDLVARFHAEAAAAAKLTHPNVVQIHYIGEDQGLHFFAMQHVEGESLAELLARRGRLPLEEALAVCEQALAGLQAAHERGLIHRDVKPGNILLDHRNRRALLADFGLVKFTEGAATATATGVIMGTVDYISPEQGRGSGTIDARTDLYSMGVVLYQMLSGELPFHADSPTALIFQHVYEPAPRLDETAPDVPPQLVQIVARLLEKSPDDRYSSAGEVLADLRAFREGRPLPSQAAPAGAGIDQARGQKTQIIPAPDLDPSPILPAGLIEEARPRAAGLLDRAKARFRSLYHRHAPEFVRNLENTQQQIDGAIYEYERRHRDLTQLVAEAEDVADELDRQAAEWSTAATEAEQNLNEASSEEAAEVARRDESHCRQEARDVAAQAQAQREQLDVMRLRLDKVSATLQQLVSQRDLLNARLNTARAQVSAGRTGRKPMRRRLLMGGTVLALVFFVVWITFRTRQGKPPAPAGTPETASLLTVPGQAPMPALAVVPFGAVEAARHQQQWADYLGLPVNYTNSIGMEFRLIPPGTFVMGGAADGVATTIEQPFYLGADEVTQDQYEQVMGTNPSERKASEAPVHNVSWDDAVSFCQRLSELPEHVARGDVFRLPTEADWEYACRAGSAAVYSFGDDSSRLGEYAWFGDNSSRTVHPVGQKKANAWSLFDMYGNVYEWSQDQYGTDRVLRGGCWSDGARGCMSASRRTVAASDTSNVTGFRVVLEITPERPPVIETPPSAFADTVYLTELPPVDTRCSFGLSFEDISVNGARSEHGIWTHPWKESGFAVYDIGGQCNRFQGAVGINDSAGVEIRSTDLKFSVLGDNTVLWHSRPFRRRGDSEPFSIDVSGVHRLEIRCETPVAAHAHAVWLEPRLTGDGIRSVLAGRKPLVSELVGHGGPVRGVAISADNRLIASGSDDHSVRVWDAATGECLQTLTGHEGAVWAVAFSLDGTLLASGGDDSVLRLWNPHTGEKLAELTGHSGRVLRAKFSRNGQRLVSCGNEIIVWDTETRKSIQTFAALSTSDVAISPDNQFVAYTGDEATVTICDISSREVQETLESNGTGWHVEYSFDGKRVICGTDNGAVVVWDPASDEVQTIPSAQSISINGMAVLSDSDRVVTTDWGGMVKIWDFDSRQMVDDCYAAGHEVAVATVNGEVIVAGGERKPYLCVWRPGESSTPAPAVAPFDADEAAWHQQQWADYLGVPVDYTNSAGMEFRLIPPGEFAVPGSDGDAAQIDHAFYLGADEVTQEQYEQVMGVNPSERKASEDPVHDVSWDDAVAFCRRLSELPANAAAGDVFRLPTEAEWEYACRAGTTGAYSFGNDASPLGQFAWFRENSDQTLHPVGQKAANPWGLYDMHGNVWEWCRDELDAGRAIRGGCWYSGADLCRSAYRREIPASDQNVLVGFRVVLETAPKGPHVVGTPLLHEETPNAAEFEAAMATARAQFDLGRSGPGPFDAALRSVAASLHEVPVTVDDEPLRWHTWRPLETGSRQHRFSAFRFKSPLDAPADMYWVMASAKPRGTYYILPVTGRINGFHRPTDVINLDIEGVDLPPGNHTTFQGLTGGRIQPGAEYIVWMALPDDAAEEFTMAIRLLPAADPAGSIDFQAVTSALGLSLQYQEYEPTDEGLQQAFTATRELMINGVVAEPLYKALWSVSDMLPEIDVAGPDGEAVWNQVSTGEAAVNAFRFRSPVSGPADLDWCWTLGAQGGSWAILSSDMDHAPLLDYNVAVDVDAPGAAATDPVYFQTVRGGYFQPEREYIVAFVSDETSPLSLSLRLTPAGTQSADASASAIADAIGLHLPESPTSEQVSSALTCCRRLADQGHGDGLVLRRLLEWVRPTLPELPLGDEKPHWNELRLAGAESGMYAFRVTAPFDDAVAISYAIAKPDEPRTMWSLFPVGTIGMPYRVEFLQRNVNLSGGPTLPPSNTLIYQTVIGSTAAGGVPGRDSILWFAPLDGAELTVNVAARAHKSLSAIPGNAAEIGQLLGID